jgi:hypothetical protein
MSEGLFAVLYAALWVLLFAVLFRLDRRSQELQATIRRIKKYLHTGWPDSE